MPAVQDSLHLGYKFKNRIYESTKEIIMGHHFVSRAHLQILIDMPNLGRNDHQLTQTDVASDKSHEKMNTKATAKICQPLIVELLKKHVPGSEGTQLYLRLINFLLELL